MRIAFVGKGGSGKTTFTALFSDYIQKIYPTLVVDGDLNMHIAPLLGLANPNTPQGCISHPTATKEIREYLRGRNHRIRDLAHFRKTTPPTNESGFIRVGDTHNPVLRQYGSWKDNLCLLVVGAYDTEEIGAACYHNNLAIFENILSHLIDGNGVCVSDMVAGVDAFANTLHMQFDMLVLVVEPTRRGVEVYKQYEQLSSGAGIGHRLFVVGNKTHTDQDRQFLLRHIPSDVLIGFFDDSPYLRIKDQEGGALSFDDLEPKNQMIIKNVAERLSDMRVDQDSRLPHLFSLHKKYVSQASVRDRFGDLTNQIDESFSFASLRENNENFSV